jgi:hypothetical protein
VSNDDASQGDNLEESARQHNLNLQRLIDAIGGLLAASASLLTRLQQILSPAHSGRAGESEDK